MPTANPDQLLLFKQKQLDGVWTVEPWVSLLETEAGGKVLVEEPEAITTLLVARRAFSTRDVTSRKNSSLPTRADRMDHQESPGRAALVRDELAAETRANVSQELIVDSQTPAAAADGALAKLQDMHFESIIGNAARPEVLKATNPRGRSLSRHCDSGRIRSGTNGSTSPRGESQI